MIARNGRYISESGGVSKPRGRKTVAATLYKVLTQGDMELPEYIEKCWQIIDTCGWPEDANEMALSNAILLGLDNP